MILVVDDHADTRVLLVKVLTVDGFKAAAVSNADEAMQTLETGLITCLVVDYQMPGTDGVQLAKRVRSDPRFAGVRIVLFSGYDAELPSDAAKAGIDATIVKARQSWREIVDAVEQECAVAEHGGVHWSQMRSQPPTPPPTLGAG